MQVQQHLCQGLPLPRAKSASGRVRLVVLNTQRRQLQRKGFCVNQALPEQRDQNCLNNVVGAHLEVITQLWACATDPKAISAQRGVGCRHPFGDRTCQTLLVITHGYDWTCQVTKNLLQMAIRGCYQWIQSRLTFTGLGFACQFCITGDTPYSRSIAKRW